MNRVNIREIQELLGQKNIETTMVYTHVLRDMSNAPESPLDRIYPRKKHVAVSSLHRRISLSRIITGLIQPTRDTLFNRVYSI